MRLICIFLFFTMLCGNVQAQNIEAHYKDGRSFSTSTAVLAEDICLFSLNGCLADWSLVIDTDYGVKKCMELKKSAVFEVCADKCDILWRDVKPYFVPGDSSTYYKGNVVCDYEGKTYTIGITFNLAPSKPVYTSVDFSYRDFDFEKVDFVDPSLNVKFKSNRFTECYVYSSDPWPTDDCERNYFMIITTIEPKEIENGAFLYSDWYTWEESMALRTANKYGLSQLGDTLTASDYIKDEKIVNALNELLGVDNVTNEPDYIKVSDGKILTNANVRSIVVLDLSGKAVLSGKDSGMPVSSLPKGVYIVKIVTLENRVLTKKILL